MKIQIINVKDTKILKHYDVNSCLIPTENGMIFIDENSRKITVPVKQGIIKLELSEGFIETNIEKNGLCYFDKNQLFIFLK
jgi:hypothetical protein